MAVTYCTSADVSETIGLMRNNEALTIGVNSYPTLTNLDKIIELVESQIDNLTDKTWKTVPRDIRDKYLAFEGLIDDKYGKSSVTYRLKRKPIRTLDAGESDEMLVLYNGVLEDWIALGYEASYPYESDKRFYFDYPNGKLMIFDKRITCSPFSIKLRFRYGGTIVPPEIKFACIYLTGIHLLQTHQSVRIFSDGDADIDRRDIIANWERLVEDLLSAYKKFD